MQKVALIGLGVMGSGMAANWLAKGFAVGVYNRTAARAAPLAAKGATVAASPRAAADGADFVFAMVADDAASRSVWLGSDGALAGMKPGAVAVECSTLSPAWVRELAEAARKKGADFLDAPVGGSRAAAAEGKLMLFVGGDAATLARARAPLEAISARINHLGPVGAGATWKLINNVMSAAHMAVLAEGLAIAEKAGIDLKQAADLIRNGAPGSPMVIGKLPRFVERNYASADFSLKLMHKDVAYAAALANAEGVRVRVIPAVGEVYALAEAQGLGDHDVAAIREVKL